MVRVTPVETFVRAPASVEVPLRYTDRSAGRPVAASTVAGGEVTYHEGSFATHAMTVLNGRRVASRPTLDREGFRLVRHRSGTGDFLDPDRVRAVYYPEMTELIARLTGAVDVAIFDHTVRSGNAAVRRERHLREPVHVVHNDYTAWSGPQRVRDVYGDRAGDLLARRMAIVQVWRPVHHPARRHPLALCDARSLAADDLVAAERRHPGRVGEIYQVAWNPAHRWIWFPAMRCDEALVFTCYDSATDGRPRVTAHTAFDDPTTPASAPERASIEIRAFAFFDEPPGGA
jgi:hypothetical protein